MTEQRTHPCIVHKAKLSLGKNESIQAFSMDLKKAAKDYLAQKYNVDLKKGSVYPMEVFADKAVFGVIPDFDKPPSNDFIVAFKYSRGSSGQFQFGDTMKVKKVTTYVADKGVSISKSKGAFGMSNWEKAPGLFHGAV